MHCRMAAALTQRCMRVLVIPLLDTQVWRRSVGSQHERCQCIGCHLFIAPGQKGFAILESLLELTTQLHTGNTSVRFIFIAGKWDVLDERPQYVGAC